MTLLKELLNRQVNEAAPGLTEVDAFHKRMAVLDGHIDFLENNFREGSQFEKLLKDVNADMSYFDDAIKALNRMRDSFNDLHMATDTKIQRGDHE